MKIITAYAEPDRYIPWLTDREYLSLDAEINKAFSDMYSGRSADDILTITGEEAVITITGPLEQTAPPLVVKYLLGGVGYDEIRDALFRARSAGVKRITLLIDSPGGAVIGAQNTYDAILAVRAAGIDVTAVNTGMMASAAYYIACACDRIYATSPENLTGSIGVIIYTVSYREAYERAGYREIIIRSQNAQNKMQPVDTERGAAIAQDRVDAYERMFLSAVSAGRGMPVSDVISKFGQGLMFVARDADSGRKDAVNINMIDGVIDSAGKVIYSNSRYFLPVEKAGDHNNEEEKMQNLNELLAAHPAVATEYERTLAEAAGAAREKERAEIRDRIRAAMPFLISGFYSEKVKEIAGKVISGDADISSLDIVAAIYDGNRESAVSAATAAESAAAGPVPAVRNEETMSSLDKEIEKQSRYFKLNGGEK